jgi:hypothetical protein
MKESGKGEERDKDAKAQSRTKGQSSKGTKMQRVKKKKEVICFVSLFSALCLCAFVPLCLVFL